MARLLDLSHDVATGMPVFPGDPEVRLTDSAQEDPWRVLSVALGSHSGTHIDAARHFVPGGVTIDRYPLERFVVPSCVVRVDAGPDEEIGWAALRGSLPGRLPPGAALLLNTGWDRHWGAEEMVRHPFLGRETCERLVELGLGLVGTDALNIDSTVRATTHAHEVLLGADVLVVENLTNLKSLSPGHVFQCAFVPLKLADGDGSPIRAYAWADPLDPSSDKGA